MNRFQTSLVVLVFAAPLYACGDTSTSTPKPPPAAVSAPAPVVDTSIPPPATPPINTTDSSARGTDTPATNPMGTMSKRQESESMPMAGQGNGHSSPSLDPAKK